MADFKLLRGNRILLDVPEKEESKVILDEETQADLEKEYLSKFDRLTVYAVGDLVTDINVGDEVLVDLSAIRGKSVKFTIGGKERLLVSPFDIILVW